MSAATNVSFIILFASRVPCRTRGCSSIKRIIQWGILGMFRQVISTFLSRSIAAVENEERRDKTRERERLRSRGTWRKERRRLRCPDRFERESLTFGMRTIGARAHPGSSAWLQCVCTVHTPSSARRRTRARARSCRGPDQQSRLKVGIKVSRNVIARPLSVSPKPNFYLTTNIIVSLCERTMAAAPIIN